MPPRHGKSTLTSNFFPPYALGHHPDWEIIAASHTQGLALKFSGFVRDILRDPAYVATFPETLLNPDSQSKEAWDTLSGGGYLAAGVNTGITGRGAHIFIIDDPVKDMEAADSVGQRDSTWEWYLSTASTRLAPGGGVLGIMTLWNEDDWGGRIIDISESGDGDKFEIVRYPAINEGYAELLAPNGVDIKRVYPNAANVLDLAPFEDHKVLRMPNEALHSDRYTLEALLRIKKNYYARGNQRIWSALYQQNPTIEDGNFFTKPMIRFYTHAPVRRFRTIYQAWDFAITEKQTSDYTVGCTLLQDENDNLFVLDVKRFRSDDSVEIVETILDYYVEWGADLIGFEDGQIWKTMAGQFERRCKERRLYPPHETLQPLTDKKVRAMPLRGRMQLGKVHFPENMEWFDDCRKELMSFPAGKHDDQVDALAWCVRLTLNHNAPHVPQPQAQKGWRDKLPKIDGNFGDTSSMAA
jgi:predicted phage terminase large subunit-like protein